MHRYTVSQILVQSLVLKYKNACHLLNFPFIVHLKASFGKHGRAGTM